MICAFNIAEVAAETILIQFSWVLLSQKRQVSGEISSASTIVPSLSLPNSSLKSISSMLTSAKNAVKISLIFRAYFLLFQAPPACRDPLQNMAVVNHGIAQCIVLVAKFENGALEFRAFGETYAFASEPAATLRTITSRGTMRTALTAVSLSESCSTK